MKILNKIFSSKGFIGIGAIIAIVAALLVGGGAVYFATKISAPASQNAPENNFQSSKDQSSNDSNTTTGFSIISPREGDQWTIGKTYPITLSGGLLSDYHVLLQSFAVINDQGKTIGMICPPDSMKKGDGTFSWVVGTLMSGCAGTDNTSVGMPHGRYQISFTENDSNGDKVRTAKSGWFNVVAPTVFLK
jgi:hypothetical protein